jgi:hypothetical protein
MYTHMTGTEFLSMGRQWTRTSIAKQVEEIGLGCMKSLKHFNRFPHKAIANKS